MSELPRVSLEEGDPSEGERRRGNPTLRVFGRVLLVAAVVPLVLGLAARANPVSVDLGVFAMLFVLALPVVCFVAALVQFVRGYRAEALGFLLGGIVGPIVGFGTCFASYSAFLY
jgi:hypothetical protein